MKKKTKLGVAIAGAVLMASAGVTSAVAANTNATVTKLAEALPAADGAVRFIVKYREGTAEAKDIAVVNRELGSAVSRAGLARTVAATRSTAARPGVSTKLLRRMGMPGWSVVSASRHLTDSEAAAFMRELAANPAVESVEIDRIYRRLQTAQPNFVPNDPNYSALQWNFHGANGVRAEQAWERSTGEGVVVAVIDTGIVKDHLDLAANVIPGYDMITDKRISRRDSDARAAGGWDEGDWIEANYCTGWATGSNHPAEPSSWHGSHVGGTVAQVTNNATGLAGLAHNAKVMPVRVLGSCGGFGADISDGILWAAGVQVPGLPLNENPAEVINMSLGSVSPQACPASYQAAIDQANAKGSIIVVAAGNDDDNANLYTMTSCNNVISVGASRINGGKAWYSSWGTKVDIAAPGGGERDDGNPNGYIWQMINGGAERPTTTWRPGGSAGTSMASPHVAAVAAMVQSVVDTPLTWAQMRDLLKSTATPFPVAIPANKPIGAGILNADAALIKATTPPCDPAVEDCGPLGVALTNKVALNGLAGGAASETLYHFEAKAGQVLTFMTYGGSGDVAMYVSFEEEPSASDHDAKSARAGNSETVRITAPKAGVYYVKLVGTRNYSGVSLVARQ